MPLTALWFLAALLDPTPQASGAELARDLERMQQTARVLYVAAHPDDENTQFLGYMANARGWRAAYLSLTRGEGGQNAIGDELVHGLGLIRTWELLTARGVDGAEQWISRQRDFGYSKSAEETLSVWGDEDALGDVVRVVRRYRPHVIVTRFPEEGSTHGHHLASAQLARRAFEAAADPTRYPEQLTGPDALEPWAPSRLLYNVPLRWMGGDVQDEWFTVDLGTYDPLLGVTYGELSAQSRSMHRSQAFGSAARRGPDIEAFELLAGSTPTHEDPFADIPSGWDTRPGGGLLSAALAEAVDAFDARHPYETIPAMLSARDAAAALESDERADIVARIDAWIVAASGLHLDARSAEPFVAPGASVDVSIEAIANATPWTVERVSFEDGTEIAAPGHTLDDHTPWRADTTFRAAADALTTGAYWLSEPASTGSYTVAPHRVGDAFGPQPPAVVFTIRGPEGVTLDVPVPVRHVSVDPTLGERVRPLTVAPPVAVRPAAEVLLLPNGAPQTLSVEVASLGAAAEVEVGVDVPEGWSIDPATRSVEVAAGRRESVSFTLRAPADAAPTELAVWADVSGRRWGLRQMEIDYPHLPPLAAFLPASVRAAPIAWSAPEGSVGYVMGPGDAVASSLQTAGVDVIALDDAALESGDLSGYAAIVIGVRAFHERAPLRTHADRLWDYAHDGGRVIVQYQTNNRSQVLDVPVGPAPIEISRGRVTVEDAPMTWLPSGAALRDGLHTLGDADFDGWVQERGLYFASSWDPSWEPLLELADPGEEPQHGALLVNHHGDGAVFYMGLSLFRQLPSGVPGAYRLLANLLAYEVDGD